MKFIIDEDLSPRVARYLCQEFCFDAIAVRDRGLLGATDPEVLEYAFNEDRILVTANVRDFEKLAAAIEIHAGIILKPLSTSGNQGAITTQFRLNLHLQTIAFPLSQT
jgi:predicted nuclease of predicted toxin-antitoxin system